MTRSDSKVTEGNGSSWTHLEGYSSQMFRCYLPVPQTSGTTATVAVVVGWEVLVANVGDSLAFLDTGSEVVQARPCRSTHEQAAPPPVQLQAPCAGCTKQCRRRCSRLEPPMFNASSALLAAVSAALILLLSQRDCFYLPACACR